MEQFIGIWKHILHVCGENLYSLNGYWKGMHSGPDFDVELAYTRGIHRVNPGGNPMNWSPVIDGVGGG